VQVPVLGYHWQSEYEAQASLVVARSLQRFTQLPLELTRHWLRALQVWTVTASFTLTWILLQAVAHAPIEESHMQRSSPLQASRLVYLILHWTKHVISL